MDFFKANDSDPGYRDTFGNVDIEQFNIYTGQQEYIGRVIELLVNKMGQVCYAAVNLGSGAEGRQVLLPLGQFRVDQAAQRIYVPGLTKAQVRQFPDYQFAQIDPNRTVSGRQNKSPEVNSSEVVDEETIRLLEERLIVDRERHKVGEITVRKQVETHFIQVPVRREKLIVEQVSPEHKQLASIDLNQGKLAEIESIKSTQAPAPSVDAVDSRSRLEHSASEQNSSAFIPLEAAHSIFQEIMSAPDYQGARARITFEDANLQSVYDKWLARYLEENHYH